MRSVRSIVAAFALGAAAASPLTAAIGAQAGFSDTICPEATHYVQAVGRVRTDDAPQRIYEVAQAAADAYSRCSRDKLTYGFREAQHYADTRGAGFAVVAARALIAMRRLDDARALLLRWRDRAQEVADWQTETEAFASANVHTESVTVASDHRPSMYRASAREIVQSADQALLEIDRLAGIPRRQAPLPSPSPR
jgi:hypothetical protein